VKRLVVGGAVLALGLGTIGTSFAGQSDNPGARKAQLMAATDSSTPPTECQSAASSDATLGAVSGFVIINAPGQPDAAQKVNGEVSLKQGLPNELYTVYIADVANNQCLPTGVLQTNNQGNGNSHIDMPDLTSGTYYVVLRDSGAQEAFATDPVTVR
jgi:hypothetical protein